MPTNKYKNKSGLTNEALCPKTNILPLTSKKRIRCGLNKRPNRITKAQRRTAVVKFYKPSIESYPTNLETHPTNPYDHFLDYVLDSSITRPTLTHPYFGHWLHGHRQPVFPSNLNTTMTANMPQVNHDNYRGLPRS